MFKNFIKINKFDEKNGKDDKKRIRTFSTEFKKEKVQLIEEGKITVVQISKLYEVSRKAVYNWLKNTVDFLQQSEW
ncbi:MAG: transposase [Saprospiraceae bacterium]|nr:transposase [Saprospiraceae bacterium]